MSNLFTRRHFVWLAELAVDMALDKEQVQCLIENLPRTNDNFDVDKFLAHMNTYLIEKQSTKKKYAALRLRQTKKNWPRDLSKRDMYRIYTELA